MPNYPQLVHLSVPELIGAAGGDPWKVDDSIQAGTPREISELAGSFYNAGVSMTQTSDEFNAAKKRFIAAWDRDDPAHPINDSAEVQRATQVMHLNKEALTRVGVDLQNIAASLAEAQRSGHISISGLNARLVQIDKTITAEIQKAQADGVQLDWSGAEDSRDRRGQGPPRRDERPAQHIRQPAQPVPHRDGVGRLRPPSPQRRSAEPRCAAAEWKAGRPAGKSQRGARPDRRKSCARTGHSDAATAD